MAIMTKYDTKNFLVGYNFFNGYFIVRREQSFWLFGSNIYNKCDFYESARISSDDEFYIRSFGSLPYLSAKSFLEPFIISFITR